MVTVLFMQFTFEYTVLYRKGLVKMTENEKKLIQAKHRLEQAQNRNRVKEHKAQTRRLIQEGAILEKVVPNITAIELDNLEDYLLHILKR